jgi:hypothetical protein
MKKIICLLTICCFVLISFAQVTGNDMFSIAQIKNGIKSKRISSYDTSGNNNDRFENIKPGEKKSLFNLTYTNGVMHGENQKVMAQNYGEMKNSFLFNRINGRRE